MGVPIIIAFRESFEIFLIIIPLLVYLYKINRVDLSKYIYFGSITGILASIITGKVLFRQVEKLEPTLQQLFSGLVMIFLAGLILYSILMISNSNKQLTLNITDKYDIKLTRISLFLLPFITIFRESLEIILFLLPSANKNPLTLIIGIFIGVILASILAFIIFKASIKLNLQLIFSALTIILIFIGGEFLGEGFSILFPQVGSSIELLGKLIFIIPLLYLFLKKELKKYLKKQ